MSFSVNHTKTKVKNSFAQSGQALLIVIMVLATVLTVVLATTFTARTDTQSTKLEEEAQRSLAAAEAGIEKALEQGLAAGGTLNIASDVSSDLAAAGFTGTVTATAYNPALFISPLIAKDDQYTYYLADYNKSTNTFSNLPTNHTITICFGSSSSRPAIEATLMDAGGTLLDRTFIEASPGRTTGTGIVNASSGCSDNSSFGYNAQLTVDNTHVLLVLRVLYAPTSILVSDPQHHTQGLLIRSSAKSTLGTQKAAQLFQSYPQLPADFFVSQF